jgi:hypothetical protein
LERLCPRIGDGVMAVRDVVQAAAGSGGGGDNLYVEDVFSTYLYTGNSSTQTITNGIDLGGEGGLVWIKKRSAADNNVLVDTERPLTGSTGVLFSDLTTAQTGAAPDYFTSFNSNGFTVPFGARVNGSGATFASWTFRKAPKFFDVVTWTGTGGARTISHNLGSTPGCIIVKWYNVSGENWTVYHRGLNGGTNPQDYGIYLNLTNAAINEAGFWNDTEPTSTQFTVGGNLNSSFGGGGQYVAYLFAHDAGGFGDDGEQNVISCGSFTTDGSGNATVNLGFEPQWALIKKTTAAQNWVLCDTMRGWNMTTNADKYLAADTSSAESNQSQGNPTATGFNIDSTSNFGSSSTFIYIAIRRGPMKTPESGTSVYNAIAYTGNDASNRQLTGLGFPPDLALVKARNQVRNYGWEDRLRGADKWLVSSGTDSEGSFSDYGAGGPLLQNGITIGANGLTNEAPTTYIFQGMRRAPGFMDVVAYTGTGSATTVAHNLAAVPELMIVKSRSYADEWPVYSAPTGNNKNLTLNTTSAQSGGTSLYWNLTTPTASVFSLSDRGEVNSSGQTYIAYLFASCPGVSKVGSYVGNGTSQTIDCGFSNGARFVMVKQSSGPGSWYVWDTVRGIGAGNDPLLQLNLSSAEYSGADYIDPNSSGFTIKGDSNNANTNGQTFIFLAIA